MIYDWCMTHTLPRLNRTPQPKCLIFYNTYNIGTLQIKHSDTIWNHIAQSLRPSRYRLSCPDWPTKKPVLTDFKMLPYSPETEIYNSIFLDVHLRWSKLFWLLSIRVQVNNFIRSYLEMENPNHFLRVGNYKSTDN